MYYAKSRPNKETLKEHTDHLIDRFRDLKKAYSNKISNDNIWDLLYKASAYHDLGKANNDFQKRMHKALKTNVRIAPSKFGHIPHNYLSPFFLPLHSWNLTNNERDVLIQAIAYHHERKVQPQVKVLSNTYKEELVHHFDTLEKEMDLEMPNDKQIVLTIRNVLKKKNRITESKDNEEMYYLYILIKGLLHRLDHAASAHVPIEVDTDFDIASLTKNYITEVIGKPLRQLQKYTYQHQNKNVIIVAQTGMGKTEASLLWAGKDKTFFTLPIRVSLNALYDRVRDKMNYSQVGLLHGTSASYLDKDGNEDWEVIVDQSKYLSSKLLFTTIDQILKFPFKYKGYEKYFATMAFSKIVIDEIQAYNPWIVAVLLKAIEMIHKIGGQFMIMTATLPQIYLDELENRGIIDDNCVQKEFTDDSFIRHRIHMKQQEIIRDVEYMEEMGSANKVLIIVNTVKKAVEMFECLNGENVHLLHSRFIQRDRALLEDEIKRFEASDENGIWITTQLVEASIDIDFDILFTELSSIDSLLQRFGRCYRNRQLDHDKANIFIYTENVSGISTRKTSVYDQDIVYLTKKYLSEFNHKTIIESDKVKLVKKIYSKEELKDTQFYKTFQDAVTKLDVVPDYEYTNEDAQKILRGNNSKTVIPREIYDQIYDLFEQLEKEQDAKARSDLRREIEKYTLSVPIYQYKDKYSPVDFYQEGQDSRRYNVMPYLDVIDVDYDFDSKSLLGIGLSDNNDVFL